MNPFRKFRFFLGLNKQITYCYISDIMGSYIKILLVESQFLNSDINFTEALHGIDAEFVRTHDPDQFRDLLFDFLPDIVVCSDESAAIPVKMVLSTTKDFDPDVPVVIILQSAKSDSLVDYFRAGATDVVFGDDPEHLTAALIRIKAVATARRERADFIGQLMESEAQIRNYINKAPEGIFIMNAEGFFLEVNPAACLLSGYSEEALKKMAYSDLVTADFLPLVEKFIRKLVDQGKADVELRFIRSDNEQRWLWVKAVGMGDDRYLCFISDITDKKEIEQSHLKSELKFHQLFEESVYGIALHEIICDTEGIPVDYRFLDLNPAYEQVTGLSREKTVGRTVLELLPNIEPFWIEKFGKVALTGETIELEDYAREFDKYYEVKAYSPAKGQFVVLVSDVTQQKQLFESLRKSEEMYRMFFDYTDDVLFVMDLNFRYQYVSQSIIRFAGYSADESLKHDIWSIVTPESEANLKTIFAEQLKKIEQTPEAVYESVSVEYEFVHRSGELQYAEATVRFATEGSENISGIIGVARNVTKRKLREQRVMQRNAILNQLNKIGLELWKMSNEDSIEHVIREIDALFAPFAIVFSKYNPEKDALVPQLFSNRVIKNKLLNKIVNEFFAGKAFKVRPGFVEEMMNLKTVTFSDDLAEITFGAMKPAETVRLERLLGKKYFAALPVSDGNTFYGALVLVFNKKEAVFFEDELQAFSAILRSALSRNSSENAVRKSELKYRTIIENTSDIFVVTNGFEPLYFNNKALEFLQKFELSGNLFQLIKIIDKEDQQFAYEGYQQLTSDSFFEHIIRVYHREQTYWFRLNARIIEWEGIPAVLTIAADISHIKRSETLLSARNKVLSKMNEFIQLLHHAPLQQIYGHAAKYLHELFQARHTMFSAYIASEKILFNTWSSFPETLRNKVLSCLSCQPDPNSIPVTDENYKGLLDYRSYSITHDLQDVFLHTIDVQTANELTDILNVKQFACMPMFDNENIMGSLVMMFENENEFELADELFAFVSLAGSVIQRRMAENQSFETSISLKRAQEVAKMGSWNYDLASGKMQWSEQLFRILQINPDTQADLNQLYQSMVLPEDLPKLMKFVEEVVQTKQEAEMEVRVNLADGSEICLLNKLVPIIKNGQIVGIDGVNIEITELKKSQTALIEKQNYLQSVFTLAPVGIFTTDLDGVIIDANETFASIIGERQSVLIGFNTLSIPNKAVKEVINKAIKGETGFYEGPYVSMLSGKKSNIRFTMAPVLDANGDLMHCIGVVDEISDIVEANKKLRESEEWFTKSFYMSPIPMIIANLAQEEVMNVNPAFEQLMECSAELLKSSKNQNYINFLLPDDFHRVMEKIRKGKSISNMEVDIVNTKGIKLNVLLSMETYQMTEKTYTLTSIINVTELKQQQLELQKLMRAIEQLPVSIVITNTEGNIEYVNPKVVESTGYSSEELLGQNPRVLKSGEMKTEDYQLMYQSLLKGHIWRGLFHNKAKNGSLYWEKATIAPVLNETGQPTHYIAIKEDITHQKALEEALASSEYRYREIFLNNPIPMWIYDVDSLHFKAVNAAAVEQYGYSEAEFLSMNLKSIRPEEDIPLLMESLKNLDNQSKEPRNFRHITKSGQIIDVELASYVVPGRQGENLRMVVANNITDKNRARKALEEAKALAEASDKLKTNFLNNISHEVRTPLNGILGATALITDPTMEKDELPELAEIISLSTERLIQTITDYMDISMLSSGSMPMSVKGFRVLDLIGKLRDKYAPKAHEKQLEFCLDYPSSAADLFIESDSDLLFKALSHVVANAIKFTVKGEVSLGYEPAIGNVSFWVKDTGIGIASGKINKVFEYFTQEDDSNSRQFEGSGLGLAIAKGIIQQLQGTIHVDSVKGQGTTFTISLPIDGSLKKEGSFAFDVPQNEPRILLAEDDEANFTVIELLLRKSFNAKVIRAVNGKEAIQIFSADDTFDLILMDIKMPVMDGLEATRILRNEMKTQKPIVAITAFAMSGDEQKALDAGCNAYLAKPVTRRELVALLKQLGFQQH